MNITLDDTSPSLNYSSQWRRQPAADDHYFLNTYRASQSKSDTMTFTFEGSGIYIYGSRGPNHGNYSVQFDDSVQFFPGFSNDVKYQSLLFSRTFPSGTHSIVLTNQENLWLDVDFIAITIASTVNSTARDPGAFSSTVSPAPSPSINPTGSSITQSDSSTTSANSSPIFFILTIILACVIGISLFLLVGFCWWKRRKDFEYARELSFRYGKTGKPTPPNLPQEGSDSGPARSSTFGNALLGMLPGSRRGSPPPSLSASTSAPRQEKKKWPNVAESTTESRGEVDSIALSNFGERPRFLGAQGGFARSDNGSTTELSESRSWKTGDTATPGMSSSSARGSAIGSARGSAIGSARGWGYNTIEKDSSRAPGSPKTVTSNLSDSQLSQWTAKPAQAQRTKFGAPTMPLPSDASVHSGVTARPSDNAPTSNLTATQLVAQRQRQEGRPFSPARSDITGYSTSDAATYASQHKKSKSGGSGGYAHPTSGGGGPQPLKPPPRTERDRERERLEKIEREERERQERLASAKYDRVAAVIDRNRYSGRPPPSYSTLTQQPSYSQSSLHSGTSAPPNNFDRDLELARAGSPSNSARSNSARGTVATGSLRDYTPTPDLAAHQPGHRAYTPDDRAPAGGGGGSFTSERYNGSGRQQERSYSPAVGAWEGRGTPLRA